MDLNKKVLILKFRGFPKIPKQFIIIVFNSKRNPNIYILKAFPKEFSLCYVLKFSNPNIFETWKCKPFINWSDKIHSLKNLRPTTLSCEDRIVKIRVCGKDMIPYEHIVLLYIMNILTSYLTVFHILINSVNKQSKSGISR